MKTIALVLLLSLEASLCLGREYYLDPVHGKDSNTGTAEAPLPSLQEVAASAREFAPGDVLILRGGHHGSPVLRNKNAGLVTVKGEPGASVRLKSLRIESAQNWLVQGLEISPETAATYEKGTILSVSGSSDVVVERCFLYSVKDTRAWTTDDWNALACNGIKSSGSRNIFRDNHLLNVNFGIDISASSVSNLVQRNTVENFSGDGLRGLGDFNTFEYNTVKNCYKVNSNHDDAFQSWSSGPGGPGTGVVRGIVLRGNLFINYEDPNQPHRGTLQGIGCFDGMFEDFVIENNVIITDHWHGITLMGARNCRIVNNTVVDLNTSTSLSPWIQIANHKNGTASTGNIVRNNIAMDVRVAAGMGTVTHNLKVRDFANNFIGYPYDLRLKPGSPAIDAGTADDAPVLDKAGFRRPADGNADGVKAWDIGAFEAGATAPIALSLAMYPSTATFEDAVLVRLVPSLRDALVYYTVDGSEPSEQAARYEGPITLARTTELKARAFTPEGSASDQVAGTFTQAGFQSGTNWLNHPLSSETGVFSLQFSMAAAAQPVNAVTGISQSGSDDFNDLAVSVRFSPSGVIDCRDGDVYRAEAVVPYEAGLAYRVVIVADIASKRYSAYVVIDNHPPVVIARDYAFRPQQANATSLGFLSMVAVGGSHRVSDVRLWSGIRPPSAPRDLRSN